MEITLIPRTALVPDPNNLRVVYDTNEIKQLAVSIASAGLEIPFQVRPIPGTDQFMIVAGHRRLKAIEFLDQYETDTLAQPDLQSNIPCIVKVQNDADAAVTQLIENLLRVDLDPFEEAGGYQRLIKEFKLKQRDLAGMVGRSQAHISKRMKLLALPEKFRAQVREGRLTIDTALTLAELPDENLAQLAEAGVVPSKYEIERVATQTKTKTKVEAFVAAAQTTGALVTLGWNNGRKEQDYILFRSFDQPTDIEGVMLPTEDVVVIEHNTYSDHVKARHYRPVPASFDEQVKSYDEQVKAIKKANAEAVKKHAEKVDAVVADLIKLSKTAAVDLFVAEYVSHKSYHALGLMAQALELAGGDLVRTEVTPPVVDKATGEITKAAKTALDVKASVKEVLADPKLTLRVGLAMLFLEQAVTMGWADTDHSGPAMALLLSTLKDAGVPKKPRLKVVPPKPTRPTAKDLGAEEVPVAVEDDDGDDEVTEDPTDEDLDDEELAGDDEPVGVTA